MRGGVPLPKARLSCASPATRGRRRTSALPSPRRFRAQARGAKDAHAIESSPMLNMLKWQRRPRERDGGWRSEATRV
jgi:hypothetical protein